jgi:hypothetical protein
MRLLLIIFMTIGLSFSADAQRKIRVRVKSMDAQTPSAYQDWPLIFLENFDSLNLRKWDRSTAIPVDDFPCGKDDGDPYFFMRPENVFVKDGFCHILATKKSNPATDTLCQPRLYGSGELKTLTYQKSEVDPFLNYNFPTDTYVEARIRAQSSYKCHLGTAFWLWGLGQELDVLEMSGVADNAFSTTLHEPELGKHPTRRIYVKDKNGDPINMTENFLNFGCMYSDTIIRLYINGQEVYSRKPFRALQPFNIRLGNGYVSMGRPDGNPAPDDSCFPSEILIDYVRVFQHPNRKSIEWLSSPEMVGSDEFCYKATYLPDAKYEWSVGGLELRKESWDAWNVVKLKASARLKKGERYPIKLKITFPKGYTEVLEKWVVVQ